MSASKISLTTNNVVLAPGIVAKVKFLVNPVRKSVRCTSRAFPNQPIRIREFGQTGQFEATWEGGFETANTPRAVFAKAVKSAWAN